MSLKEWILSLTILERSYFVVGCVFGLFMIVQIILLLVSAGGDDLDFDGDGDFDVEDVDVTSGLSLFTVKTITAFFTIGAWVGLATSLSFPNKAWLSVILALASGTAALFFVAWALKMLIRLQCSGNVKPQNLVGLKANVYVSIPAMRSGRGKITLTAFGRFMEIDAMTEDEAKIMVDSVVEIISMENECALVKRVVHL